MEETEAAAEPLEAAAAYVCCCECAPVLTYETSRLVAEECCPSPSPPDAAAAAVAIALMTHASIVSVAKSTEETRTNGAAHDG